MKMALLITVMMVALLVPQSVVAAVSQSFLSSCVATDPVLMPLTYDALKSASTSTGLCPNHLPHPGGCPDIEWSNVIVPKALNTDAKVTDGATVGALRALYMDCAKKGQNLCGNGMQIFDLECWMEKAEAAVS